MKNGHAILYGSSVSKRNALWSYKYTRYTVAGARSAPSCPSNPHKTYVTARHTTKSGEFVWFWCHFLQVKYTDLHVITSKGFSTFSEKVTFWWSKKGTLNRHILSLKARLGGSTFGIPKNRCVKLPLDSSMCPPPYLPPAKINYFPDGRTNERTNERTNLHFRPSGFSASTDVTGASRNNYCLNLVSIKCAAF